MKTPLIQFLFLGVLYSSIFVTLQPVMQSSANQLEIFEVNTDDLVIYTYDSLLNITYNPDAFSTVFTLFEERENCKIKVVKYSDAQEALVKAISEKNNPVCDIVIGIDNVMAIEARQADLFQTYTPNNITDIDSDLIQALDPDHYLIPYDYGLISLIYQKGKVEVSNENFTLNDLTSELASKFVIEDPTLSSTGLGFLLWTIAVYDKLLDQPWTDFWSRIRDEVNVQKSWGEAFSVYYSEEADRPIMVSYGTDPAYSSYYYNDSSASALISHEKNRNNAWLQIEGLGILKNAPHTELAKKFVDWFISPTVQNEIPLNQWMYPANSKVTLPPCFDFAINPADVDLLNSLISREELETNLPTWKEEWERAMVGLGSDGNLENAFGLEFPATIFLSISSLGILVLVYKRRPKND